MAKKKSRKKGKDKKKTDKKKLLKLKLLKQKKASKKKDEKEKAEKKKIKKKKVAKKKAEKKKESKKKAEKKAEKKKVEKKKSLVSKAPGKSKTQGTPVSNDVEQQSKDHSSNYNVQDAITKLRALKTKAELLSFTRGEKRVTISRVIPAAMNKLEN